MKFEDIRSIVEDLPSTTPHYGRVLYDFVLQNQLHDILELGFHHGTSTCYLAAALDELGGGRISTIDLQAARHLEPSISEQLERANLGRYVAPIFESTSYTWALMRMIEEQTRSHECVPIFDFCFIDGAHTWDVDGFSFFLVDKLLKPRGWILFDDLDWTHGMGSRRNEDWVRALPEEQRELPQVGKVFELLVRTHPGYENIRIQGTNWGWARKRGAPKTARIEGTFSEASETSPPRTEASRSSASLEDYRDRLRGYARSATAVAWNVAKAYRPTRVVKKQAADLAQRSRAVALLPAVRRALHPLTGVNAVLKTQDEVESAKAVLREVGLQPHDDDPKNWDCFRTLSIVIRYGNLGSRVLDVGAPRYAVVLPWLERLGLRRLEACDLCYDEEEFRIGSIRYTKQDLLRTSYASGSFDFVTSISVIEHGVDLEGYFLEMSRLLKPGGYLLTSTDYWPEPIDCEGLFPYGRGMGQMKIFNRSDVENMTDIAARYDLVLTEPIDFSFQDRVVHWKRVDRRYTFIFFALRKIAR